MAVIETAPILTAFYARATANSTFNTAMGGSASVAGRTRHGIADQDEAMPFMVMSVIDGQDSNAFSSDGVVLRVQCAVYDKQTLGPAVVMAHMDKLRLQMDGHRLTVANHAMLKLQEDTTRGPFLEGSGAGEAWRIDADYLVQAWRQ